MSDLQRHLAEDETKDPVERCRAELITDTATIRYECVLPEHEDEDHLDSRGNRWRFYGDGVAMDVEANTTYRYDTTGLTKVRDPGP